MELLELPRHCCQTTSNMLLRGVWLGLRVVSARPACRPRRYSTPAGPTTSVTINRVAPELTVGVREAVLWPGRPDMCRLAEDAQGLHLAATLGDDQVIGVVSLFVDGAAARFRKFAVLEAHRGAGVGSRLLQAAEDEAASAGAAHIECDARAETAAYYEKRGYAAAGPPFAKYEGSEQLYATMRKPLDDAEAS